MGFFYDGNFTSATATYPSLPTRATAATTTTTSQQQKIPAAASSRHPQQANLTLNSFQNVMLKKVAKSLSSHKNEFIPKLAGGNVSSSKFFQPVAAPFKESITDVARALDGQLTQVFEVNNGGSSGGKAGAKADHPFHKTAANLYYTFLILHDIINVLNFWFLLARVVFEFKSCIELPKWFSTFRLNV